MQPKNKRKATEKLSNNTLEFEISFKDKIMKLAKQLMVDDLWILLLLHWALKWNKLKILMLEIILFAHP